MRRTLLYLPSVVISPEFLNPEMVRALRVILETSPPEAEQTVVTSAFREGDQGKHGDGLAVDVDANWDRSVNVGDDVVLLKSWAATAQARLGADYDTLAHGPRWHIHCEFDPKVARPITAGYYARIQTSKTGRLS